MKTKSATACTHTVKMLYRQVHIERGASGGRLLISMPADLTIHSDVASHHRLPILIGCHTLVETIVPGGHGGNFQHTLGICEKSLGGQCDSVSSPPADSCHGKVVDDITGEGVVVVCYQDNRGDGEREGRTWGRGGEGEREGGTWGRGGRGGEGGEGERGERGGGEIGEKVK